MLYRVRADLAWRDVAEEVVVLEIDQGEYFSINSTGSALWHQLSDGAVPAQSLVAHLRATYDIDTEQAESDVTSFLEMCVRDRLVDVVEGSEP
jgi:hypothetical protein